MVVTNWIFLWGLIACVCLLGFTYYKEKKSTVDPIYKMPISFDVAKISVSCTFHPTETAPNVEHLVTPSFPEVAQQWAEKILTASGAQGQINVVIEEASITAFPVAEPRGFWVSILSSSKVQYTARCVIRLETRKTAHASPSAYCVQASVNKVTEQNVSAEKRDVVLRDMMQSTLECLRAELLKGTR
jgi:hypothetical protein